MTVQQLVAIAQREAWVFTDKFRASVDRRCRRVLQTQIAEDGFNREKAQARSVATRIGREHLAFKALIESDVLGDVHHHDVIAPQGGLVPERGLKMPKQASRPLVRDMSVDCDGMVSYQAKTTWHSAPAEGLMRPYADLATIAEAVRCDTWPMLRSLWFGALMSLNHHIVVRRKSGDGPWGPWLLPLQDMRNSCCLFWPMVELRHDDITWFEPSRDVDLSRMLIPVWNVSDWQAWRVEWLSPVGQRVSRGLDRASAGAHWRIRAHPTGKAENLLRVAARCGFWRLSLQFLQKLMEFEHVDAGAGAGLFDVLWGLVQHILGTTDEETLGVLSARLDVSSHSTANVYDDLLACDEAMAALDRNDQQELDQEQKKARAAETSCVEFRQCSVQKRTSLWPKAASRPKRAARPGRGRPNAGAERLALPHGDLLQPDLKPLCPPGGSIWRANQSGGWSGHFPPFPRVSKAWALYGHRWSAILVLRSFWESYALMQGEDVQTVCPVEGLFNADMEAVTEGAVLGRGSASSGGA